MTQSERLALLKVMVNPRFADDDAMLSAYLEIAGNKINTVAYPYGTVADVPARYHYLQVEIATYMVNKRGADFQTAHTENGIQRVYDATDVPPSMLRRVIPYCGAIGAAKEETDD